jgi:hypothetical protein
VPGTESHIVKHRSREELIFRVLNQKSDFPWTLLQAIPPAQKVLPPEKDFSLFRLYEKCQLERQASLTSAGGSQDGHDLAGIDGERAVAGVL